jgi:hypothetical protein
MNMRLQAFYFVEKADQAPDWMLQLQVQLLFPDKPDKMNE